MLIFIQNRLILTALIISEFTIYLPLHLRDSWVDTADALPVAKFLYGRAEGIYQNTCTATPTNSVAVPISIRYPGFLTPISAVDVTVLGISGLILAGGFVVSLSPLALSSTTANSFYPENETIGGIFGTASILLEFNHIDSYQALVQQDTLVMNGGFLSQYDSAQVTELGFHINPDTVTQEDVPLPKIGSVGYSNFTYYVVF